MLAATTLHIFSAIDGCHLLTNEQTTLTVRAATRRGEVGRPLGRQDLSIYLRRTRSAPRRRWRLSATPSTANGAPGTSRWSTASSRPRARQRRFSSPPMPNGSGSRPASGCAMRPRSRSFASVAAKASSAARSPKRRPTRALCGPRQGRRQRARGSGARARLWRVLPTGGVNVALRLPTAPTRGSTRAADRRASDRAVKGSHLARTAKLRVFNFGLRDRRPFLKPASRGRKMAKPRSRLFVV